MRTIIYYYNMRTIIYIVMRTIILFYEDHHLYMRTIIYYYTKTVIMRTIIYIHVPSCSIYYMEHTILYVRHLLNFDSYTWHSNLCDSIIFAPLLTVRLIKTLLLMRSVLTWDMP
jgi:hypothetical protein